jgi:hypothetical protein
VAILRCFIKWYVWWGRNTLYYYSRPFVWLWRMYWITTRYFYYKLDGALREFSRGLDYQHQVARDIVGKSGRAHDFYPVLVRDENGDTQWIDANAPREDGECQRVRKEAALAVQQAERELFEMRRGTNAEFLKVLETEEGRRDAQLLLKTKELDLLDLRDKYEELIFETARARAS